MDNPTLTNDPPYRHRLSKAEFEALRALHQAVRAEVRTAFDEIQVDPEKVRAGCTPTPNDAELKAIIRAGRLALRLGQRHRTAILAWAFVRGLPYRRIEAHRHLQVLNLADDAHVLIAGDAVSMRGVEMHEHHPPDAAALHDLLVRYLPDLPRDKVDLWLAEPHKASGSKLSALVNAFNDRARAKQKAADAAAAQLPLPLVA